MTLSIRAIVVGTLSLIVFVSLGMLPLMSLVLSSLAIPLVPLILLQSRLSFSVWLGLPLLLLRLPHPCLHLFHRRDHHLHLYLHLRHHHHLHHHLHHHHHLPLLYSLLLQFPLHVLPFFFITLDVLVLHHHPALLPLCSVRLLHPITFVIGVRFIVRLDWGLWRRLPLSLSLPPIVLPLPSLSRRSPQLRRLLFLSALA